MIVTDPTKTLFHGGHLVPRVAGNDALYATPEAAAIAQPAWQTNFRLRELECWAVLTCPMPNFLVLVTSRGSRVLGFQ